MVPVRDFSGLTSWAWAFAKAAAIVPMVSLERCMAAALYVKEIEADGTRLRTFGADAVTDRFLGILWHQRFQLRLRALVVEKGLPGIAEQTGKFRPRIRGAHIYNPNSLDPWLRRFDGKEARGFAVLDTPPELPLSSHNKVLIERIGMGGDLNPFAAAGNHREDSTSGRNHPHIVLQLRHIFFGRNLFRERQGQHELGLEHRAGRFDAAVQRGRHPAQRRMTDLPLNVSEDLTSVGLIPAPVQVLSRDAKLDNEIVGKVLRLDLAPLLAPKP